MDSSSLEMDSCSVISFRYDLASLMAGSARKWTLLLTYLLVLVNVNTAWRFLWLGQMAPMQILHGIFIESFQKGKKRP